MSQDVLSVIASFFGSLGFAIIYNIRGRRVWIPGDRAWGSFLGSVSCIFTFCE